MSSVNLLSLADKTVAASLYIEKCPLLKMPGIEIVQEVSRDDGSVRHVAWDFSKTFDPAAVSAALTWYSEQIGRDEETILERALASGYENAGLKDRRRTAYMVFTRYERAALDAERRCGLLERLANAVIAMPCGSELSAEEVADLGG